MRKFVIECPKCGRYAEASKGFFAKKHVECACGYKINVKAETLASKVCPHCGNTVVYDQSKGEGAKCPVCHERINTRENLSVLAEFTCPSCSCKLSADKNAKSYTCPLCETQINVQERIAKEAAKNDGLISVVKYEGDNTTFVWKHPIEDFNMGSQLIVHESQEAIFFRDGKALDLFGPGRHTLVTQNIPILEKLYKIASSTDIFHSEVYFINMTTQMGIKWGTDSKVRLFDPASGLHIEIGACGNFSMRVCDSRKLVVKLVGTTKGLTQGNIMGQTTEVTIVDKSKNLYVHSISEVVGKFKALVMNKVKSNIARIIKENSINILEIDEYMDVISEKLKDAINVTLEEYGLTMPEFYITSILTPDDDANFKRLKQQFAEKTLRVREEEVKRAEAEAAQSRKILEAQTEAQLKMVSAQGEAEALKIKAMAEAEAYKAQAMAEAAEMQAKGYTYQQETAREVGLQAMKNGITGGGNGGGGSGIGDIAGLAVTLGAMGSVVDMTKDALNPIVRNSSDIGSGVMDATAADAWNCTCGCSGIKSNFCPNCGNKKPEPKAGWDCACGCKGITSNFCPDCGSKKPEPPAAWDCVCGCKGITSNFCPDCGTKKPESWDCPDCGNKGINAKFCPDCGHKREG
ncbi:MAG: SPFH domain-containing protein [Clostridia bacterium]|nr:SPFH domain-containing protein [Clostridia bacterium]